MSIELELIDCNCNDCIFMERDIPRFNESLEFHHGLQLKEFERKKKRIIDQANYFHREKGDLNKFQTLSNEATKMRFQFDKSVARINYGNCNKLNKNVRFIPKQIQLETQECFKHRRL